MSAAQNISRARASGQIRYARALRDNLPAVMAEFATGAIDFRMIATIITRTENVDATVMPLLDEALARHAVKWMRLSEPKLRDRIDLWVTMFDPPGCGCRPRSTTTAMSRLSRPVRGWPGSGPTFTPPTPRRWIRGSTRSRARSATPIRAPGSNAAPTRAGPWLGSRIGWSASAVRLTAPLLLNETQRPRRQFMCSPSR